MARASVRRAGAIAASALALGIAVRAGTGQGQGGGLSLAHVPMATALAVGEPAVEPGPGPWGPEGAAVAIAVERGRAGFDVPADRALVIVSATANEPGPFGVRLAAEAIGPDEVESPALADDGPGPRRIPTAAAPARPPESPRPLPAGERTFWLMARDGDLASASNYRPVAARLRALGRGIQVYVDIDDLATVAPETLRDLVAVYDERIGPALTARIGPIADVDGDGRLAVLISGRLDRRRGSRAPVDGYVRGADFDPDVPPPFGNRADLVYLGAALAAGPHLRTILAHECTHAAAFGRRRAAGAVEEEAWLDEAMAHLAEDDLGFARSNLDYRVGAFLADPGRYGLAIADYHAADLFRSHGHRGATYLFLRWCADRCGPGLLGALARSDKRGVANVEAATGASFAALYRGWTVALARSGLGLAPADSGDYRAIDPRGNFGGWPLAGPRFDHHVAGDPPLAWESPGTATRYVVVEAQPGRALRVEVEAPTVAGLQVTAIVLPDDLGRLELAVAPDGTARLTNPGTEPLDLDLLAWEPVRPDADPRTTGHRRGTRPAPAATLAPGATIDAPLPSLDLGRGPLVLRATARDPRGRRVAAWALLGPDAPPADPAAGL